MGDSFINLWAYADKAKYNFSMLNFPYSIIVDVHAAKCAWILLYFHHLLHMSIALFHALLREVCLYVPGAVESDIPFPP